MGMAAKGLTQSAISLMPAPRFIVRPGASKLSTLQPVCAVPVLRGHEQHSP